MASKKEWRRRPRRSAVPTVPPGTGVGIKDGHRASSRRRRAALRELQRTVQAMRHDVAALSSEVALIRERSLCSRMSPDGSLAKLLREYFAQFQRGLLDGSSKQRSSDVIAPSRSQFAFVSTVMDRALVFGNECGILTLLEQWRRFSQYHDDIAFVCESVEMIDGDAHDIYKHIAFKASAKLRVLFSRQTIENVFPHLLEGGKNQPLVERLVGQWVTYDCILYVVFDDNGVMQQFHPHLDFTGGIFALLGSLIDTATVLDGALITDSHRIGRFESVQ